MAPTPNREAAWNQGPHLAIALLIDLAQRGEIDPWDVQVIEVIDRCLNELAQGVQTGWLETDLSQSGQAFLDAAVLVLLKANTLESLQEPETPAESPETEELELEDGGEGRLPLRLERQLRRRPTAVPPPKRPVTLQELIDQLRLVAAAMEKQSPRTRRSNSHANASARAQMRAALELASQENLSETAVELEQFLATYWSNQTGEQDGLTLDQLLGLWSLSRGNGAKSPDLPASAESNLTIAPTPEQLHDRVGVFWSLLLLSAQSKVELVQQEFYQDLKIRALSV
ncbi:MAG TPA: segregation/condensation protein A [Cyanobacteria bacterium UBA11368]|nr:segregation/condensation protein A [Cyanobacteria bacterium UBA11368]